MSTNEAYSHRGNDSHTNKRQRTLSFMEELNTPRSRSIIHDPRPRNTVEHLNIPRSLRINYGPIPRDINAGILIPTAQMSLYQLVETCSRLTKVMEEGLSLSRATEYKLIPEEYGDPEEVACSRMSQMERNMWNSYKSGSTLPHIPEGDPDIPDMTYPLVRNKLQKRTDAVRSLYNNPLMRPYHYLYFTLKAVWMIPLIRAQARITAAERNRTGGQVVGR